MERVRGRDELARLGLALLLVLAATSCTSQFERRDWSRYDGPGAAHFQKEEIEFPRVDDPLEPANRVMAWLDHQGARFVVAPLATGYRAIVPRGVRTHLDRAGDNLLFPKRFLGNLLQGKLRRAGTETIRFVLNSTVGLLGLHDPAERWGIRAYPEDFGQVFAKWGWTDSTYVFWPILGPSTVRDSIGNVPDALANPLYWTYPPAEWFRVGNKVSDQVETALRYTETRYDAYEITRTLYTLDRELDVSDFLWESDESGPTQTLDAIFLTFEDPKFPKKGDTERVRLESTGEKLPYTFWLRKKPAPLVYVVPGLGGHRLGDATLGLAEIIFREGNSVVTVSNPTNFEFIERASTVDVPGFGPADARDLHRALTAIDADLERRFPGRFTSRRLAGISMGAFQALHIAATEAESKAEGLLPFDVYIALDPPVNLEHGMSQLDRFYNAPLAFPPKERDERIEEILGKVLFLSHGDLDPAIELPFTRLEAEFLIGLAFRTDLRSAILLTQERHDLGVLRTKRRLLRQAPAYREASEYSFLEYMYAFVLRSLAKRDPSFTFDEAGARRMFEQCDLRAVEAGLRANDRVRLFANENDFLLRPEDLTWLRDVLGDRATFFPAGGHLGNLHRKAIQEVIHGIVEAADEEDGKVP
jgi:ABC-type transporter lipoprotein component MlaA